MSNMYEPFTNDELFLKLQKLTDVFALYLEKSGITPKEVHTKISLLERVVIRVDKRRTYYEIFHKDLKLNASKRVALSAYWILKFRPFTLTTNIFGDERDINIGFAIYLILSAVRQDYAKNSIVFAEPSDSYIVLLKYGFQYWDLSKESIMLLSETLSAYLKQDTYALTK